MRSFGVFAIDGQEWEVENNIWLVGSADEVVVVDAAHDARPIVEAVAGRRVAAILLTHGHNDHVNAALALAEATGDPPVYLHPDDLMLWHQVHPGVNPTRWLEDGLEVKAGDATLTVLVTVVSRPSPTRVIVDAGRKAMQREVVIPEPKDIRVAGPIRLSAEHTDFEVAEPAPQLRIGDKLEFVVGYGDTTVCLHDELIGVRGGFVEVVWPVLGRGKLT